MINKSIFYFSNKFLFFNSLQANVNNKIIVKVGNEIITNFELKNKILTNIFYQKEVNQANIDILKSFAKSIN